MILIRTHRKIVSVAFAVSFVGAAGLLAGCGDGAKKDVQIQSLPDASNVAQAVAKNYSEQMAKKYGAQAKKRP
jgi:hypothetical protein